MSPILLTNVFRLYFKGGGNKELKEIYFACFLFWRRISIESRHKRSRERERKRKKLARYLIDEDRIRKKERNNKKKMDLFAQSGVSEYIVYIQ
jgi:hypothetical protein